MKLDDVSDDQHHAAQAAAMTARREQRLRREAVAIAIVRDRIDGKAVETLGTTARVHVERSESDGSAWVFVRVWVPARCIDDRLAAPCPGKAHARHAQVTCNGACCTACGGPIDENEECRC